MAAAAGADGIAEGFWASYTGLLFKGDAGVMAFYVRGPCAVASLNASRSNTRPALPLHRARRLTTRS